MIELFIGGYWPWSVNESCGVVRLFFFCCFDGIRVNRIDFMAALFDWSPTWVNHVIGSSFRLDSNRHEACACFNLYPGFFGMLQDSRDFWGFFFWEILHNSLEFLRIFEDSSGFFRILQDSLGFSRFLGEFFLDSSQFFGILKDFWGFFRILQDSSGFFGILEIFRGIFFGFFTILWDS